MAKHTKNLTIRLDESEFDQLQLLTSRYKVSQANVIRWAIEALGEYVQRNDNKVTLPIDFDDILNQRQPASSLREQSASYCAASGESSPTS